MALLRRYLFEGLLLATVTAVLVFWRMGVAAELWGAYTYLGAAMALFVAEQIIPRDRSWNYVGRGSPPNYRSAALDLFFLFIVDPLSVALRLAVALWVVGQLKMMLPTPQSWTLPVVIQIVLLTLAADLLRYGVHRSQHRTAPFWRFHALHHMPTSLVSISASRTHPLDDLITYTPETILFLLLGFDAGVVSGFYCVVWVIALVSHANVHIVPGNWIAAVLMHPRYHLAHHTLQSGEEPTCNFGEITTLPDRLFGTFKNHPFAADFKVGVIADEPRSFVRELFGSFYLSVSRL